MEFKYKSRNTEGEETTGVMEAESKIALSKQLKSEGQKLIYATEKTSRTSSFNFDKINESIVRVTLHEKIVFARNLGAMINAGLTISRALEVLGRQTQNKKLKRTIREVAESISQGESLSDSMAKHTRVFPPLFVAIVKVGEETGTLSDSLQTIAIQMEKSYTLRKKVKGAMMYPSIVLIAMVIIGALMMIYVVPTLTQTFKELDVDLPASTQLIMNTSDFLVEHTLMALFLFVAVIAGFVFGIRTKRGSRIFDFVALHIPVVKGLVKQTNAAATTRTISSLLSCRGDHR